MSVADELLQRMRESDAPMPTVCDVAAIYAQQMSVIAKKLTPGEVETLVLVGVLIYRQTARFSPAFRQC